ncbi:MAG: right-handed parallel beta-helix repeat-containing protein, partial [Candidatus Zixiibacteriota bacterium]
MPDNYPTIQTAIDASVDGDVIVVRPGTYYENIDFLDRNIVLQAEQGPAGTIIDGVQSRSVVTFNSPEIRSAVLEGFTISNGTGTYWPAYNWYEGGGVYCVNGAGPVIRGCVIKANSALRGYAGEGGGIYCKEAFATIEGNTIVENIAYWGGGISCQYGRTAIRENTIRG